MNLHTALERLNLQLPLKRRQDKLTGQLKAVHQAILYSLVKQGRPLSQDELAKQLGQQNVQAGLQTLGSEDLVVLDAKGKNPLGAYPVTIEQTPHKIAVNGHTIHAMCALDAVSVAPMFDAHVQIDSTCHVSKKPIDIRMQGSEILEAHPSNEITIGIRWQIPSSVAAHSMCMEMVFLKDRQTAESWQANDIENISLFALTEAVEFGKRFFLPLLDYKKGSPLIALIDINGQFTSVNNED